MAEIPGPLRSILFDMDGTLIDPREGIFDSLRHALDELDVRQPPAEDFPSFVGPPLRLIFSRILETTDPELLENAVAHYRRHYSSTGIYQCVVYPGIAEMLKGLTDLGLDLFVATIKPGPYARKIMAHTGLAPFFRSIHGSEMDGSLDEKDRLVKGILDDQGLDAAETVMVGDRSMDIAAAKENALASIAVSYGFGTRRELVGAGADHIADSPGDIVKILKSLYRQGH